MASLITKRVPRDQVSSYGVVVTDDDGRVKSFKKALCGRSRQRHDQHRHLHL